MEGPGRRSSLSSRLAGCAPLATPCWRSAPKLTEPRGPWRSRRKAVDPPQNCGFLVPRRGMGVDENGVTVPQSARRKVAHLAPRPGFGPRKARGIERVCEGALAGAARRRTLRACGTCGGGSPLRGVPVHGHPVGSAASVPGFGAARWTPVRRPSDRGPSAGGSIQTAPPWSKLPP